MAGADGARAPPAARARRSPRHGVGGRLGRRVAKVRRTALTAKPSSSESSSRKGVVEADHQHGHGVLRQGIPPVGCADYRTSDGVATASSGTRCLPQERNARRRSVGPGSPLRLERSHERTRPPTPTPSPRPCRPCGRGHLGDHRPADRRRHPPTAWSCWSAIRTTGTTRASTSCRAGPSKTDPGIASGPCANDVCNYLLLGSDSRAGLDASQQTAFGTNADSRGPATTPTSIMLVHTDPKLQKAIIAVVPPRPVGEHPGPRRGQDQLRRSDWAAVSTADGPQLVARTVQRPHRSQDQPLPLRGPAGFEGVVQTLGGVDMCIPAENVNTPGYVDQETATGSTQVYVQRGGPHRRPATPGSTCSRAARRLDATQALAYVRTRHLPCDAAAPDFYRIGRQQQFLRAVINRAPAARRAREAAHADRADPAQHAAGHGAQHRGPRLPRGPDARGSAPAPSSSGPCRAPSSYVHHGHDALKMDPSAQKIFSRDPRRQAPRRRRGCPPATRRRRRPTITVPVVDHASGGEGRRSVEQRPVQQRIRHRGGASSTLRATARACPAT